ncbi:hypothetical protein KR044_003756 [Drosophila immigrans]|nr:hypothetical protein KR044_003756 [Drosophila immigrans]
MHVSSENVRGSSGGGSARLSVYFEQDLLDDNVDGDVDCNSSKSERVDIRRDANDSNNNTVNDSILSSELNESNIDASTPPVPVMRRHKSTGRQHSRSRERSFVNAANAVVGGARSVARSFKRISLIESSSGSSNKNSSTSNLRDRTAQESAAQDGVDPQLKANAKHKPHYNSTPSLPQSYSTSGAPLQPSGSAHSLGSSPSPSPRSNQSKASSGGGGGSTAGVKGISTAKHDQQTSAAAAAATSSSTTAAAGVAAASTSAAGATGAAATTATPPEKEKKRKEVSSSRVKKFHRHFSQVSKDEKLINYFSCALVGDIPLQGHLYITEEHFAFYSNVFGYVTKVVIPTASVRKISKEKTAKIIPNAVGVATADERHVFGSFISREAAFRLMCTVCTQLATGNEILPKPLPVDVELTEEYLLDDDSSCSISGNESPPHLRSAAAAAAAAEQETQLRQRNSSDRHSGKATENNILFLELKLNCKIYFADLPGKSTLAVDNELAQVTIRSSAPPVVHYEEQTFVASAPAAPAVAQQQQLPPSSTSAPATVAAASGLQQQHSNVGGSSLRSRLSRQLPTLTELHVLYLGIMLAIMLALFSVFLLYRILDIEAKTHLYNTPVDFNLVRHNSFSIFMLLLILVCFLQRSGNDEDIFAEALRWQKELQDKSTAEAQHILSKNLEQISKVRRSLETLSMLIHDRRAGYVQPETAAAAAAATEMQMDVEAADGSSSLASSSSIPSD